MSDIGSKRPESEPPRGLVRIRSRWPELVWGLFAAANVAVILVLDKWETVPFHFVWVSLTILYGLRVWRIRTTAWVLAAVMVVTGLALGWTVAHGAERVDELTEVPLMAAMFVAMVWHAQRRQAATEEVRRLAEIEHRLLEREREFLRDASHELRTPITVARGHAELLSSEASGQAAADAGIVLEELERLSRISERLLVLAAAEHPGFLRPAGVDVDEVLRSTERRWRPTADRRWRTRLDAVGSIRADRERLEAALDAVVENAVAFTGPGDAIEFASRRKRDRVVIEVSDTGRGVPPDQLDRIFDRFSRANGSRGDGAGGTGLGLAIVKAVVEAHGGTVAVRSTEGLGTTFSITLPGTPATAPVGPGATPTLATS
jgi:signal transduction histidine kinase